MNALSRFCAGPISRSFHTNKNVPTIEELTSHVEKLMEEVKSINTTIGTVKREIISVRRASTFFEGADSVIVRYKEINYIDILGVPAKKNTDVMVHTFGCKSSEEAIKLEQYFLSQIHPVSGKQ